MAEIYNIPVFRMGVEKFADLSPSNIVGTATVDTESGQIVITPANDGFVDYLKNVGEDNLKALYLGAIGYVGKKPL